VLTVAVTIPVSFSHSTVSLSSLQVSFLSFVPQKSGLLASFTAGLLSVHSTFDWRFLHPVLSNRNHSWAYVPLSELHSVGKQLGVNEKVNPS
jgi:hypothetical protein